MPVYDFAVYSSDDGSLTLYHRRRILLPLKGMVFEGKRVSACFRIGREGLQTKRVEDMPILAKGMALHLKVTRLFAKR